MGLECFVKVVVRYVKYARLAIAEMDISDEELVSSTKKDCGENCHSECQDLLHKPNYAIQMRVFGSNYNPNPNCDVCFPAFLIKTVIVASKICKTTLRSYIFSELFVFGARDAYIDLAKYYQKCLIKHPNKPPGKFCIKCHKKFMTKILIPLGKDNLRPNSFPSIVICHLFNNTRMSLDSCQHGCGNWDY